MFKLPALLKALPFVLLLVVGGGGFLAHRFITNQYESRVNQLQTQVDRLNTRNVALEAAAEQNIRTIEELERRAQEQITQISSLQQQNDRITRERDEYLSIFRRHDLTRLALARPGLIQNRINSGTKEVFRTLEEDSREIRNADNDE